MCLFRAQAPSVFEFLFLLLSPSPSFSREAPRRPIGRLLSRRRLPTSGCVLLSLVQLCSQSSLSCLLRDFLLLLNCDPSLYRRSAEVRATMRGPTTSRSCSLSSSSSSSDGDNFSQLCQKVQRGEEKNKREWRPRSKRRARKRPH